MSFAAERHAREERNELLNKSEPLIKKIERGQRLSNAERRELEVIHLRVAELNDEIGAFVDARLVAERSSAEMGGIPSSGSEDTSAESRAFTEYLRRGTRAPELRAAGEGTGSAGGYLVPPGWWQRLQVALKAYGGVSNDFELVESDTGQSMLWATNNPTGVVANLVAENTQISNADVYTFGQGQLSAYLYATNIALVSVQLSQDSAFDIDGFLAARFGEAIGRARAAAALTGTGSSQPLGILTALAAWSSTGTVGNPTATGGYLQLNTAQEVNVFSKTAATPGTATVTELTGNVLAPSTVLALIESVDPAYRALGAKFYFNDSMLQGMRGIVDGYGRPLYDSLQGDNPSLYGYKVTVDNTIPNLAASATQGPIFGHLPSAMVLRQVAGAGVMRLDERYADFLQVGYLAWNRFDIKSNDLRAAATVKAAAS